MHSALKELKIRADILLKRANEGDNDSLNRLASLPVFRDKGAKTIVAEVSLKHALWLMAREFGFQTWKQAKSILSDDATGKDFGTLLYPKRSAGFLNNWYADYHQARACLEQTSGYLLAYKRQFLVVGESYIRALGLEPEDPDWERMGRDWAHPRDPAARGRLYAKLITHCKPEQNNANQD